MNSDRFVKFIIVVFFAVLFFAQLQNVRGAFAGEMVLFSEYFQSSRFFEPVWILGNVILLIIVPICCKFALNFYREVVQES